MRRLSLALVAAAALVLAANSAHAQIRTDAKKANAILEALDDERMAEAQYQVVLNVFGKDVQPFASIVVAERQHQAALINLTVKYGITVLGNPWSPTAMTVPGSVKEACLVAVETEKANIAMYDRLLVDVALRDVRNVFTNLQAASLNNHLPAFLQGACLRLIPRRAPGRR